MSQKGGVSLRRAQNLGYTVPPRLPPAHHHVSLRSLCTPAEGGVEAKVLSARCWEHKNRRGPYRCFQTRPMKQPTGHP